MTDEDLRWQHIDTVAAMLVQALCTDGDDRGVHNITDAWCKMREMVSRELEIPGEERERHGMWANA